MGTGALAPLSGVSRGSTLVLMNKTVALVVFLVVSGGMYFLCANAHIDIFPCERAMSDYTTGGVTKSSGTCSLLGHQHGTGPDGSYDRLNATGWALLFAFCGTIGLAVGAIAGKLTGKRS